LAFGKAVEQRQPGRTIKRKNGFVLRVDRRKVRSELSQHGHRRGLIVDEYAPFATGSNLTAENDRAIVRLVEAVVFQNLFEKFSGTAFNLEDR